METTKFFQNKFGNVFGPELNTPTGRATYIYLAEPSQRFKPPKYSINILWKKSETDKAVFKEMLEACKAMQAQVYGSKKPAGFIYPPIRDGDAVAEGKERGAHPGYYYIQAKCSNKPIVMKPQSGKNVDFDPSGIAPGNLIRLRVQAGMFKEGFNWRLIAVQFIKDDGERFYIGADPREMMDVEGAEPEEESLEDSFDNAVAETPRKNGKEAAIDLL